MNPTYLEMDDKCDNLTTAQETELEEIRDDNLQESPGSWMKRLLEKLKDYTNQV